MNSVLSILNDLQAEQLLAASPILDQVNQLRQSLRYNTEGEAVSFDDFFTFLQTEMEKLPKLNLDSEVAPGTESAYQTALITALDEVFGSTDRLTTKMLFFKSRLQSALKQINDQQNVFCAWYALAVSEYLKDSPVFKLPPLAVKALSESEFSRLLGGVKVQVETLIETTQLQIDSLKQHKKLAREKYDLGKDQANAIWTSQIPYAEGGISEGDEGQRLIGKTEPEEELDEEVPAYVSRNAPPPKVGKEPAPLVEPAAEPLAPVLKGEDSDLAVANSELILEVLVIEPPSSSAPFYKTGDAKPAEVIAETVTPLEPDKPIQAVRVEADPLPPGVTFIRDTKQDSAPVHCQVCGRRVRHGQTMLQVEGGWAHKEEADCKVKAPKPEPAKVEPPVVTPATVTATGVLSASELAGLFSPPVVAPEIKPEPAAEAAPPPPVVETNVVTPQGRQRRKLTFLTEGEEI